MSHDALHGRTGKASGTQTTTAPTFELAMPPRRFIFLPPIFLLYVFPSERQRCFYVPASTGAHANQIEEMVGRRCRLSHPTFGVSSLLAGRGLLLERFQLVVYGVNLCARSS